MSTHVRSGISIKLTKDSPKLFDVQLLYIFFRATKQATRKVKYMLGYYCKVQGQLVNYHESKPDFLKASTR